MLADFTIWLLQLVRDLFGAVGQFIADQVVAIFDLIAAGLLYLLGLVPVPSFMSGGLDSTFSGLAPGILYLVTAAGLPQGLAIIGAGYVFRLGRKVATLFQW